MNTEPLVTTAGFIAAVTAVLSLVTAFGLELNDEQTAAVLGVAAVVAPLLVAALVRPKVTPVNTGNSPVVPGR